MEGRRLFIVLCGATGGAAFSLRVFIVARDLLVSEKEALEMSLRKMVAQWI